jgi:hypothetical protein
MIFFFMHNNISLTNNFLLFAKSKIMLARLCFVLVVLSCSISAGAQFGKIPGNVTDTLKMRYPTASNVTWKSKISGYEAQFLLGRENVKANFNSQGAWQKTEKESNLDKLPAPVMDGFKKSKYADWPVKEVTEINAVDKGIQYRMLVKSTSKRYLYFSPKGQLQSDGVSLLK